MKIIGIYKITSPSGKIYIGQTKDFEKRLKVYKALNCKTQIKLYNSFLKHTFENHTFEIIEQCEFEQLSTKERYWQEFYDVIGGNGLNCKLQSTEELVQVHSKETKEKMANSRRGKKHTTQTKKKIAEGQKGKKVVSGEEHYMFGKKLTKEEGIERMSNRVYAKGEDHHFHNKRGENNPNFGKKRTEEQKETMKIAQNTNKCLGSKSHASKLVVNLEMGVFYDCVREAAEAIDKDYHSILNMVNPNSPRKNRTSLIYC